MVDHPTEMGLVVPGLAQLFEAVLDAAADRRDLSLDERDRFFEVGRQSCARELPLSGLIDSYVRGAGELWEEVVERVDTDQTVDVGRALRRVSEHAVAALAAGFEAAQRDSIRAEESMRREFIDDLLAADQPHDVVRTLAERVGFPQAETYVVVVAATAHAIAEGGPVHGRVGQELVSRAPQRRFEVFTRHGEVVIVAPDGHPDDLGVVVAALEAAGPGDWMVGIGTREPAITGIAGSYAHGREALRLARLFDLEPPARFDDLLVERLLAASPDTASQLVDRILRPLAAAGARTPLLETVESFVTHGGNMAEVARALDVGARTVGYRLDRVAELSGVSPRDPDGRFLLELALRARPLVGDPAGPDGARR